MTEPTEEAAKAAAEAFPFPADDDKIPYSIASKRIRVKEIIQRLLDDKDRQHAAVIAEQHLEIERLALIVEKLEKRIEKLENPKIGPKPRGWGG